MRKRIFDIDNLGNCRINSPLKYDDIYGKENKTYQSDEEKILQDPKFNVNEKKIDFIPSFEIAGPREKLYFDPQKVKCGIITCGGLSPGINNVIRSIVMYLHYNYKTKKIIGLKYGYQGLVEKYHHSQINLTPEWVKNINELGGSVLGSSRGHQDVSEMVDFIIKKQFDIIFAIGGDGTFRGLNEIYKKIKKRKKKISIIGIPKTIDNDILHIEKTFGFESAYSHAAIAIRCAHVEALGAPNGVGLVKVMGRHSGYVASYSALALREVNLILVPEQEFDLGNVYDHIEFRLKKKGHILILVAEGAGQYLFPDMEETDKSKNKKLNNIGIFLKNKINNHFKKKNLEINLKYIDPSYMIRSIPANPTDSVFTGYLGQFAVDAAMAGKTGMAIGLWNGKFTHVPIKATIASKKTISLDSNLWKSVLKATGQPALL